MLHELRIYRCLPGRLPALHDRFRNHTLRLWDRHGIRQAGFWTVLIGENQHELYYLRAWADLAEREKKWNAFASDPDWLKAKADSEKDQPILVSTSNLILAPTDYSVNQ